MIHELFENVTITNTLLVQAIYKRIKVQTQGYCKGDTLARLAIYLSKPNQGVLAKPQLDQGKG